MRPLGFNEIFDAMATRFKLEGDEGFPPMDLLWVDVETFSRMADTRQRTGRHQTIPVIDLEALPAMKLHALKDNATRQGKDLLDIRELPGVHSRVLTDQRLRQLCDRFAGPGGYELVKPPQ